MQKWRKNLYSKPGIVLLAFILASPPDLVRGNELCQLQDPTERKSMCASVLNAQDRVRALYRFTRHRASYIPPWMYDFEDPKNVTHLSEFQVEIIKYNAELGRLSDAIRDYQLTSNYLEFEQDDVTFKNYVEKLEYKINDAFTTVDDLNDSVARLILSQPSPPSTTSESMDSTMTTSLSSSISTPSTTTPTTKKSLENTDTIQKKANYVTQTLKNLLRRWWNRCTACEDSRRKRSVIMSAVNSQTPGQ